MAILKNIIFDLGGVLINIDYFKTEKAFHQLGFTNFGEMYTQHSADEVFSKLETGAISNEGFYNHMIQKANSAITKEQVAIAWNALLLDFREESLHYLNVLSKKYQIYLLSNTNSIHQEAFLKHYSIQTGLPSLNDIFKKAYYSHEVGLRKPNKDIFEFFEVFFYVREI